MGWKLKTTEWKMKELWKDTRLLVFYLIGLTVADGHISSTYRAERYGRYYSNRYYSYSGKLSGTARYGRVYAGVRNSYYYYYNYMFTWLGSSSYQAYRSVPQDSISVCRNYEANENGTFLGIFACPLPYEPVSFSHCCGQSNAEYCCTFWDVPLNWVALLVGGMLLFSLLVALVYLVFYSCKKQSANNYNSKSYSLLQEPKVNTTPDRRSVTSLGTSKEEFFRFYNDKYNRMISQRDKKKKPKPETKSNIITISSASDESM